MIMSFKKIKNIVITFDRNTDIQCVDLLKQILMSNQTNIQHLKLNCSTKECLSLHQCWVEQR